MRFFFVVYIAGILFFYPHTIFSYNQNTEPAYEYLNSDNADSLNSNLKKNDSLKILLCPSVFSNSNLLMGTEIIDPLHPEKFFTRATRLWKSDIRIGILQPIDNYIDAVLSVRGQDSPETNAINFYEVFAAVSHSWGKLIFGQTRLKAGANSRYLNDSFDRKFWDKGLIFDFLFRGIRSQIISDQKELDFFIGSDFSSGFIGGTKFSIGVIPEIRFDASALYVARDPEYAAFGWQFGMELKESFDYFSGYQLLAFKMLNQEPSRIREIALFSEQYFLINPKWNLGSAFLYKKTNSAASLEEIRINLNTDYKVNNFLSPGLQAEYFKIINVYEIHLGIYLYLLYSNNLRIVPRIRYIITELGPDVGFLGIEGRIIF